MGRDFTNNIKLYLYKKQGGKCGDCNKVLKGYWHKNICIYNPKMVFTIDNSNIHHIIPVVDGGKHQRDNFILLCILCHIKRHKVLLKERENG
jgi:5-methylcytosine-specific restriction endonuclease McrA